MAEKEIALLKEQIARLDEKKFDLEAWKNHTIIYLERIFGRDSSKIKMLKDLHYGGHQSWVSPKWIKNHVVPIIEKWGGKSEAEAKEE